MNQLQRLYDYKSSILDYDKKVVETEYFNIINQIKTRQNQYPTQLEKINIKRRSVNLIKTLTL